VTHPGLNTCCFDVRICLRLSTPSVLNMCLAMQLASGQYVRAQHVFNDRTSHPVGRLTQCFHSSDHPGLMDCFKLQWQTHGVKHPLHAYDSLLPIRLDVTVVWHTQVMLDDMSAAYDALKMNKMPCLPPVGIQYPDFARWQIANIQSAKVKAQVRIPSE